LFWWINRNLFKLEIITEFILFYIFFGGLKIKSKIIIFCLIICLLIPLGAASASDINTTTAADNQVLSATPQVDTLSASVNNGDQDNNTLSVQSDGNLLSVAENNNLLGDDNTGSSDDFTELIKLTKEKLTLTQDYYFTSTVNIGKSIVIDGNNHTISGNGVLFNVNANGVTIHNLNFNNTQNTDGSTIIWNGDNGKMNNVNFENINANTTIEWKGNSGLIDTIYFNNMDTVNIINWTGNSGNITNTRIDKINKETILTMNSNQGTINNLTKSDNNYLLTLSLYGNEKLLSNSSFNNTRIEFNLKTYIVNSTFNNYNQNIYLFQFKDVGSYLLVSYCNFTNINHILTSSIRQNFVFDHNNVINCSSASAANSYGFFTAKDYYTVSNCYFEGITSKNNDNCLFSSGAKVYNTTVKNSNLYNMFYSAGGDGSFSDVLVSNVTFINNTVTSTFFRDTKDSLHVINCNFTDNTFPGITLSSKYMYFYNNTFDNNTIKSGNYVLSVTGSNMYIVNNTFTQNKGFSTSVLNIANTNQYMNATIKGNLDKNGLSNDNVTNTTALNNYVYADKLYVSVDGNGSGFNESDRSSWSNALKNIVYGGTLFLAPGIYNLSNSVGISCNIVGEDDGVIFNGGGLTINSFNTYLKNLTFNHSTSILNIKTSGVSVENCTWDNIRLNYFFNTGSTFSYDKELTFKNITIKNSKLTSLKQVYSKFTGVSYVFDTFNIINSTFKGANGIFNLPIVNGYTIKNINLKNVTAKSVISIGFSGNYGFVDGAGNTISGVIIDNCTLDNIMKVKEDQYYVIRDVTANDVIITSDSLALFDGYNFDLDNIKLNNISNSNVTFVDLHNTGSFDHVSVNLTNLTNFAVNVIADSLNNVNLTNVNITCISPGSFSSYDNLRFINVSFTGNNNSIFTLNDGNVLSGSVFDNVTGQISVLGDNVIIKNSIFKNMNNSGLNASCIFVDANFIILDNLTFINNTVGNGSIYFTNTSVRPSLTGSIFNDNIAINAGGALYVQPLTGDFYFTIDDSTMNTINTTEESYRNEGRFNGIGGKTDFSALVTAVYVTNDTNAINNDGKSWSTPTNLVKAYGMAGKDCVFYFVEDNVFNYTNTGMVISTSESGWNFVGNNTTVIGLKFIIQSGHGLKVSNITFKDTNDTVLTVNSDNVDIADCIFINSTGVDSKYGALIINASNVNVTGCDFINNTISDAGSLGQGAGIYINGSSVNIVDCHFENNTAMGGAHIYLDDGYELINIINNKFINGSTVGTGNGNVRVSGDNVVVYNNTFQYNQGKHALVLEGDMRLYNVSSNSFMDNLGGGLYTDYINGVDQFNYLRNNNFINNSAISTGSTRGGAWFIGGVDNYLDTLNTSFTNNSASSSGGAIFIDASGVKLSGFNFTGNKAVSGGAVYINGDNVVLSGMNFIGNNATDGGALYVNGNHTLVIDSKFENNTASERGSAVYLADNQIISLNNIKLINNCGKYDNSSGKEYDDVSYAYILPGINGKLTVDRGEDNVYYINRTVINSYNMVYITNNGTGSGGINDPTNWDTAVSKILDDGIIYIVTDNFKVNETMVELLQKANLTNVTIVGINKTKITRNDDVGKYLFIHLNQIK